MADLQREAVGSELAAGGKSDLRSYIDADLCGEPQPFEALAFVESSHQSASQKPCWPSGVATLLDDHRLLSYQLVEEKPIVVTAALAPARAHDVNQRPERDPAR